MLALASACATTSPRESPSSPVAVVVPAVPSAGHASSGDTPRRRSSSRPPDPPGFAELGEQLYKRQGCAVCHSVDGTQKFGPSLRGLYDRLETLHDGRSVRVTDAYLRESIVNPRAKLVAGHPPSMPSYGGHLDEDQIRALIAYIVTLK